MSVIGWLRKQVKDAPTISASKQEGRDVREDKSSAVNRLLRALDRLDDDHHVSESLRRPPPQRR